MNNQNSLITTWIGWHFGEMPVALFAAWKNFISFGLDFFSIPLLVKTMFIPWRMYYMAYPRRFDIGKILGAFTYNGFSRVMGALCRIVLIGIGLAFEMLIVAAGVIVLVAWVGMPLIILGLIVLLVR